MITTIKELQKSNIQLPAWLNLDGRMYHAIDIKFTSTVMLCFYDKMSEEEEEEPLDYVEHEIDDTRISISENINEDEEVELHMMLKKEVYDIKKMTRDLYGKIESLSYDQREDVLSFCKRIGLSEMLSEGPLDEAFTIRRVVKIMKSSRMSLSTENYGDITLDLSYITHYSYKKDKRNITLANGEELIVPTNRGNIRNIVILDILFPKYD